MGIFDGFGGGAPPPTYQTDNTTGISLLQNAQQAYTAAQYGAGVQSGMGAMLKDNAEVLKEVRDDLLPLKKWLIATYPDIYRQYQAVEALLDLGKGEGK